MGIILLLALAPDGELASQCAAACLMSEGKGDILNRSSLWRDLRAACLNGDVSNAEVQSALEGSRRGSPIMVRLVFPGRMLKYVD